MESVNGSFPEIQVIVEFDAVPADMIFDLAARSNAELFNIAIDTTVGEPSRAEAIELLSERGDAPAIERLIGLLTESDAPAEVRRAILKAIADNRIDKALPTLQWLYNHIPLEVDALAWIFVGYGRKSLLDARSSLGDVTALRDLILRDYLGDSSGQLLARFGGLAAVVAVLSSSLGALSGSVEQQLKQLAVQDQAAEIRRWAIDRLAEIAENQPVDFYLERLGDQANIVASGASDILTQLAPSSSVVLREIAGNATLSDSYRLWAVYTLLRIGVSADDLLAGIPNSQMRLPTTIPLVLRQAIVRAWAGYHTSFPGEITRSDIRWLIEKQQLPARPFYEAAALIEQLRTALQIVGLQTHAPIDCGKFYAQGGGTYWLLPIATNEENTKRYLYISQIGPFVSYAIQVIDRDPVAPGMCLYLKNLAEVDPTGLWQEQAMVCKQVAEGIGFTWVDETILDILVPSLCDPYPYEPDEVQVQKLLYYWMD